MTELENRGKLSKKISLPRKMIFFSCVFSPLLMFCDIKQNGIKNKNKKHHFGMKNNLIFKLGKIIFPSEKFDIQ